MPTYRLGRLLLEELVDCLLVVCFALAEADDARLEGVVPRLTLVLVFRRHPAEMKVNMASNDSLVHLGKIEAMLSNLSGKMTEKFEDFM